MDISLKKLYSVHNNKYIVFKFVIVIEILVCNVIYHSELKFPLAPLNPFLFIHNQLTSLLNRASVRTTL
jgi:hypothetical protein